MTVFGAIVTGNDVEQAAVTTLKLWLPSYLAEMERKTSRPPGSLPTIGDWRTTNRFPRSETIAPPAGFVVSPGLTDRPERRGDGSINGWWRIGIATIVSAGTAEATGALAKLYGAAIRTLLLQRPSLGGFATKLEVVGEAYDDVPEDYLPVGASAQIECDVLVDAISFALAGPAVPAPPPTPPGDWPRVVEADITVELGSLT